MMKKFICLATVLLVLVGCLSGCNFTQNASGPFAGTAESAPKAKEMLTALANGNAADAKALMHPDSAGEADAAIAQMIDFLAGRDARSIESKNIKVNSSTGTSGNTRQEQVTYLVTLTDNEVIYLSVLYLSDNQGEGFSLFQIVLGVV